MFLESWVKRCNEDIDLKFNLDDLELCYRGGSSTVEICGDFSLLEDEELDDTGASGEEVESIFVVMNGSYRNTLLEQEYGTTASLWSAYERDKNGFEFELGPFRVTCLFPSSICNLSCGIVSGNDFEVVHMAENVGEIREPSIVGVLIGYRNPMVPSLGLNSKGEVNFKLRNPFDSTEIRSGECVALAVTCRQLMSRRRQRCLESLE
ncbi:hypothetical protein RIF29_38647 [Crotalaria pallida]|uniref:Uncharacterized protein n=1 Tax=Crotalaria pallida TaxID=3830 RepID=A0AAN9E543_CROPI